MPLDPRSLQTVLNSTIYKEQPIDLVGGMASDAAVFRDNITAKAESLVDKGKNALGDVIASVGKVVDKYAPSIIAGMAGVQFRGSQGSFQSYTVPVRLAFRFFSISADRSGEIGVPVHSYFTLSMLSGFVLCENARVPLAAFQSEQTAVEEFLNGGIYIE